MTATYSPEKELRVSQWAWGPFFVSRVHTPAWSDTTCRFMITIRGRGVTLKVSRGKCFVHFDVYMSYSR